MFSVVPTVIKIDLFDAVKPLCFWTNTISKRLFCDIWNTQLGRDWRYFGSGDTREISWIFRKSDPFVFGRFHFLWSTTDKEHRFCESWTSTDDSWAEPTANWATRCNPRSNFGAFWIQQHICELLSFCRNVLFGRHKARAVHVSISFISSPLFTGKRCTAICDIDTYWHVDANISTPSTSDCLKVRRQRNWKTSLTYFASATREEYHHGESHHKNFTTQSRRWAKRWAYYNSSRRYHPVMGITACVLKSHAR